jgi:hypothetical protein
MESFNLKKKIKNLDLSYFNKFGIIVKEAFIIPLKLQFLFFPTHYFKSNWEYRFLFVTT